MQTGKMPFPQKLYRVTNSNISNSTVRTFSSFLPLFTHLIARLSHRRRLENIRFRVFFSVISMSRICTAPLSAKPYGFACRKCAANCGLTTSIGVNKMKKPLIQKLGLLGLVSFLSYTAAVLLSPRAGKRKHPSPRKRRCPRLQFKPQRPRPSSAPAAARRS